MKVKAYLICKEHGKQLVIIEKESHLEMREMMSSQLNAENRHTAICPKCGKRYICYEE